jgi:ABC-2 type transport system ATP-binding protein
MMNHQAIIQIDHVSRHFGDIVALDGLSLEAHQGEILGFLGHNGAGKTTTIRLLNGVLTPTQGTIHVFGLSPEEDGAALRQRTGVLTETPSLDERLSARDNLRFYADLYSVPLADVSPRIEALLEDFELLDRADEKVGGYSKGMRQRLALARAFLHRPELIFLDEPTSGLDPIAARHVHDLIKGFSQREGRTILLCTHNLVEAQKLCDRVAVLEHGKLLALGTPHELSRQLGHALQLDIELDQEQTNQAAELFRRVDHITGITCEKNTMTLDGISRESIPQLLGMLLEAGIRVYRVTPGEPSLEDIYFALHGEEGELA